MLTRLPTESELSLRLLLPETEATEQLGVMLADAIVQAHGANPDPVDAQAVAGLGLVVLLDGALGQGKTTLARGFVRAWVEEPLEEVPSPTFTLVQTYDPRSSDRAELWHVDLYRIEHPSELPALDLEDAFYDALCVVEWPDRLGSECLPDHRLEVILRSAYVDGSEEPQRQADIQAAGRGLGVLDQLHRSWAALPMRSL